MNIHIRTLRPDEVGKWLDFMCNEIFPDDPHEAVESMWTDDPVKDVTGIFVAVDGSDAILGSVKAAFRNMDIHGTSVPAGIISGVGVRRDMRGKGLSTQLFAACHASLQMRGAAIAHLYSKPDTLEFYQKLNYAVLPQHPGEDFFRMYRLLAPFTIGNSPISTTQSLLVIL